MERQRRTERRQRQVRRSNLAFKFIIFVQLLVIGVLIWQLQNIKALATESETPVSKPVQTMEEPMDVVYTTNGPIYAYVIGDPDFGHQYIVTSLGDIIERDMN